MKDTDVDEMQQDQQPLEEEQHPVDEPHLSISHAVGLMIVLLIMQLLLSMLLSRAGGPSLDTTSWLNIAITHGVSGYLTAHAGAILAGLSMVAFFALGRRFVSTLFPLLIATIGLTIICSEIANVLNWIKPVPEEYMEFVEKLNQQNLAGVLLCVGVIAPLVEELIFRGVILEGLQERYNLKLAFFLSSFLFGLIHIFPWVILNAFLVGLFFAWLRLQTGSLWPCIIAHSIYNSLPFFLTRLWDVQIKGYTAIPDVGLQFQPFWFDCLGVLLFAAGVLTIRGLNRSDRVDDPAVGAVSSTSEQ